VSFQDLQEFFDDGLHLPINGVMYDIPAPDHEFGLHVTALVTAGSRAAAGGAPLDALPQLRFEGEEGDETSEEARFYRKLLGPAFNRMRANGVSWPKIKIVSETVILWISGSRAMAEEWWNAGGDPKALQAARLANSSRADRRATARSNGAVASTTKRPASTNGTKSR
jgi:hypothetical protein